MFPPPLAGRTAGGEKTLLSNAESCNGIGLDCDVGGCIGGDPHADQKTVDDLIMSGQAGYPTTRALIVGNEYVHGNVDEAAARIATLKGYMDQVRAAGEKPTRVSNEVRAAVKDAQATLTEARAQASQTG